MNLFAVRLTTIRSGVQHGFVVVLISGQSTWVRKRPIDPLFAQGLSILRPGIRPVARSPLHVWIGDPAMASTPQDAGLTGEPNFSHFGISVIELTVM